jgi:S-adenosyl-L-methionine hydrolase (adenosine-forming)
MTQTAARNGPTISEGGCVALRRKTRCGGPYIAARADFLRSEQGAAFWYENSNGLAEISINQGSASCELGLAVGAAIEIVS